MSTFAESFDWTNATADLTALKWTSLAAGTIDTCGRCSSNGIKNVTEMTKGVTNSNTAGQINFAYEPSSTSLTAAQIIFRVADATGVNGIFDFINITAAGAIEAWSGVNKVLGNKEGTTSGGLLSAGVSAYIGFRWIIDDSAGELEVFVNGVSELSLTSIDTDPGGSGSGTLPWTTAIFDSGGGDACFDDVVLIYGVVDTLDMADNNGDMHVEGDVAVIDSVATGFFTDFSQSTGSDQGAMVDEIPPNDDTDYNDSTAPTKRSSYRYPALTNLTSGVVLGMQFNYFAKKADAGETRTASTVLRIGGTTYDGTAVALSTTYGNYLQMYETNPDTGLPWTISEIDALDAGIKDVSAV